MCFKYTIEGLLDFGGKWRGGFRKQGMSNKWKTLKGNDFGRFFFFIIQHLFNLGNSKIALEESF
jgi:hypothetical protein